MLLKPTVEFKCPYCQNIELIELSHETLCKFKGQVVCCTEGCGGSYAIEWDIQIDTRVVKFPEEQINVSQ
jgi:pyruvate-formate lyase-activating enzyme